MNIQRPQCLVKEQNDYQLNTDRTTWLLARKKWQIAIYSLETFFIAQHFWDKVQNHVPIINLNLTIILISILVILLTAARECRTLARARPLADGYWGLWGEHTELVSTQLPSLEGSTKPLKEHKSTQGVRKKHTGTQDQDYGSSQFKIVANTFKFTRKILVQKLVFQEALIISWCWDFFMSNQQK